MKLSKLSPKDFTRFFNRETDGLPFYVGVYETHSGKTAEDDWMQIGFSYFDGILWSEVADDPQSALANKGLKVTLWPTHWRGLKKCWFPKGQRPTGPRIQVWTKHSSPP
ncbi:hypothetical protein [Hydrogenophaga sp.]|uniref:hypothetical protein n=1 Tax=Hydrogenophaga sp. TaxID=1904254 RepID=UPI002FC6FBCE